MKDSNPASVVHRSVLSAEIDSRTRDGRSRVGRVLVAAAASSRISRPPQNVAVLPPSYAHPVHRRRRASERASGGNCVPSRVAASRISDRLTASRACTLLVYFRLNMVAAGLDVRAVKCSSSSSSSSSAAAAASAYYDSGRGRDGGGRRRTSTGNVPCGPVTASTV